MKKNLWEVILRIIIAAATAALTALGTTSCLGLRIPAIAVHQFR